MADRGVEDRHILEHARRWLPYGGCADDVLVEFGLTPSGYYARLADILVGSAAGDLPPGVRAALGRYVRAHTTPSAPARTGVRTPCPDTTSRHQMQAVGRP
jgi:hypothetical protein